MDNLNIKHTSKEKEREREVLKGNPRNTLTTKMAIDTAAANSSSTLPHQSTLKTDKKLFPQRGHHFTLTSKLLLLLSQTNNTGNAAAAAAATNRDNPLR